MESFPSSTVITASTAGVTAAASTIITGITGALPSHGMTDTTNTTRGWIQEEGGETAGGTDTPPQREDAGQNNKTGIGSTSLAIAIYNVAHAAILFRRYNFYLLMN